MMGSASWLDILRNDLRYAARKLWRSPGFTTVTILTLALGIGANVAAFTVVHGVLLSPLPYPHPEQLVRVYDDLRGSNSRDVGLSVPELWDLRDKSGVFQDVSALWFTDANLTGGDRPERVEFLATSTNYFSMLGAQPQLGRVYTQNDEQPGFITGVVLSDGFWRRTFGGDPGAIGKKIRLDSDLYEIIGVMPPQFRHPGPSLAGEVEVWGAAGFNASPFPSPAQRSQRMIPGAMGRLKPGLTIAQGQARLNTFAIQLSQQYSTDYPAPAGWTLRLVPLQEDLVGDMRTELLVLFGAVGFVLLIACVNIANLLLARSAGRQREVAVRLTLGAKRTRIITQLLAESILLSSVSGALALLAVVLMKASLLRLAPADLPRTNEIGFSPGVLVFAFFVSILTGVIFGLAPALQTARLNQVANLREGGRGAGASKHQLKISRILVVSEIAFSLVLLIGAGLLLRSFWNLLQVRPGFEPHQLMTARTWLPTPNDPAQDPYLVNEKRAAFYQEVLRRVSGLPGVEQAAVGSPGSLPMNSSLNSSRRPRAFAIDGRTADMERAPVAEVANVSSGYFDVLKTPLLRGRVFTEADRTTGQQVAVINEALVRQYWGDQDPIGQQIRFLSRRSTRDRGLGLMTIVGVVGDIKAHGFDAAETPYIYTAMLQDPTYGSVVYLRTSGDPNLLGEAIRREVQAVDPTIPVFGTGTMDEVLAKSLAARRFTLRMLGVFAAVACLLAAIGIYGVMAYTFSQRTSEIGLRMALGAQRRDILKIVLSDAALIIVLGVAAGLVGSLMLTRFLQTMLFDIKATDPITFSSLATLLAAVALLACLIPAHRASRVDPLLALRHE